MRQIRPIKPSKQQAVAFVFTIFVVFVGTYVFVLSYIFTELEPNLKAAEEDLDMASLGAPSPPSHSEETLKKASEIFDSTLPDTAAVVSADSSHPDKPYFAFINDMNPKKGFPMFPKYTLRFDPFVTKYPSPGTGQTCENMLLERDVFRSTRDFEKSPITILNKEDHSSTYVADCSVRCFMTNSEHDASDFDGELNGDILRSMESAIYYRNLELKTARPRYKVVMTTRLDSDVPVGYFSWAEYGLLKSVSPKNRDQLASAVISNCIPNSFRKEAVDALERHGISVDKYGSCFQNPYSGKKSELIKSYPFHLAFENSVEPDYVTEKFWISLEAGTVPVVIGAPNIDDFAPSNNSVLYIRDLDSVSAVALRIKQLQNDRLEYDKMLAWKNNPSQQFLALIDMAVVHSSCRLCVHKATLIRFKDMAKFDEEQPGRRTCRCEDNNIRHHHLLVRERGKFEFESVILKFESGTLPTIRLLFDTILEHFLRLQWTPVWKSHRRDFSNDQLRIFKLYAVGLTQRAALYEKEAIDTEAEVAALLNYGCPAMEVVFV